MTLLPPGYLDAVVALGIPASDGSIQYKATGFLYGHPVGESGGRYRIFLVTNRHVVEHIDILKARFNRPMGSDSKVYDVRLRENDGSLLWTGHPDSDVAAVPISTTKLEEDGIKFEWIPGDRQLALEQARELQISEGDGVFVLGFPMGLAGEKRNYTIVRQGSIARIRRPLPSRVGSTIRREGTVKLTDLRTLSKAEYAAAAMTSAGSYHRGVREWEN